MHDSDIINKLKMKNRDIGDPTPHRGFAHMDRIGLSASDNVKTECKKLKGYFWSEN